MDAPERPLTVVLANEPRAYREVISAVFEALRPEVEVFTVDPEDLDREVSRLGPHLVVCSRCTGLVGRSAPAWIELYPDGASYAVVSLDGDRKTYADVDLQALLSVLDAVAADVHRGARPRG
jgi:hypothetical protein